MHAHAWFKESKFEPKTPPHGGISPLSVASRHSKADLPRTKEGYKASESRFARQKIRLQVAEP